MGSQDGSPLLAPISWGSALFIVFWVGHAALNIWGLTGVWSKTYMEYYVQGVTGSAEEPQSQLLYKSTFWDNVEQFWNADAKAVALLVIFNGICQPLIKTIIFPIVAYAPLKHGNRERLLVMQEFTGKFSITPFYVEAVLLDAFSFEYSVPSAHLQAQIHIVVFRGLLIFFIAQLLGILTVNYLRVLQRSVAWELAAVRREEHLAASHALVAAARAHLFFQPLQGEEQEEQDETAPQGAEQKEALGSPRVAQEVERGGGARSARENRWSSSTAGLTEVGLDEDGEPEFFRGTEYHLETANEAIHDQDDQFGDFGRLTQQKKWRKAVKRAVVTVVLTAAIWAIYWYLYSQPFVMFQAKGLLTRIMTANGPTLKLSLGDIADGIFSKTHPFYMAAIFGFWFYMNIMIIPLAVPLFASIAALLRLAPFIEACHPKPTEPQSTADGREDSGAGRGSYAERWRLRRERRLRILNRWVASLCAFIRDAIEIMQPWNTAEPCVMAVYFVSPNMDEISDWIFNTSTPQCKHLEKGGVGECLKVYGSLRGGGGICMSLWLIFTVIVSR